MVIPKKKIVLFADDLYEHVPAMVFTDTPMPKNDDNDYHYFTVDSVPQLYSSAPDATTPHNTCALVPHYEMHDEPHLCYNTFVAVPWSDLSDWLTDCYNEVTDKPITIRVLHYPAT